VTIAPARTTIRIRRSQGLVVQTKVITPSEPEPDPGGAEAEGGLPRYQDDGEEEDGDGSREGHHGEEPQERVAVDGEGQAEEDRGVEEGDQRG
jgi:hypothetical protein